VTRRMKVLGAAGLVVVMAAVAGGGLATGAFARAKKPVHTLPVSGPPVTTASFTFSATVRGLIRRAGPMTLTGSGEADFTNDAVSASITLPAALAARLPGGATSSAVVQAVLSGGTVYAEVPGLSTLVGEPWISVALPSSVTSGIPGAFSTVAAALGDVNEILNFASSKHAKVVSLGSSIVDATPVTGDRITGRIDGFGLNATVWANSAGQLVEATIGVAHGASANGLAISATVDLSGYGAPVTITVPPPSQVTAVPLSVVEQFLGGIFSKVHLGHDLAA